MIGANLKNVRLGQVSSRDYRKTCLSLLHIYFVFPTFYTSFRSFSDENVPHCLTLFKLPKNRQIHNVEEVRQDEPLGSLLCCWDRHFELRSYSRYRKSRIDYYCNSTACLNYEYLRLCGDINPNPGPASKKA